MNEQILRQMGFADQVDNVKEGRCPICCEMITGFKDALSLKEYRISGMCQKCQDSVFGGE